MIDTIKLTSPEITDEISKKILKECYINQQMILLDDSIVYEFIHTELIGSYDYRIKINVKDEIWEHNGKIPEKVKLDYKYLEIECSVHKLMMGHNVIGGPCKLGLCVKYIVQFIEKEFDVLLPEYNLWDIKRIDIAHVFDFEEEKNVINFLEQLKNMKYPRRNTPACYPGTTGLYWKGYTDTIKFYAKGAEFKKHDYKRIKKYLLKNVDNVQVKIKDENIRNKQKNIIYEKLRNNENMLIIAKKLLRIEIEVHNRKLKEIFENIDKDDYNKYDKLQKILDDYYYERVSNMLKDCKYTKLINDTRGVLKKLNDSYDFNLSNSLYATWTILATQGEQFAKSIMSKASYYRHLKQLRECNIGWNQTDLKILENIEFSPFSIFQDMLRNRELKYESKEVLECYKMIS